MILIHSERKPYQVIYNRLQCIYQFRNFALSNCDLMIHVFNIILWATHQYAVVEIWIHAVRLIRFSQKKSKFDNLVNIQIGVDDFSVCKEKHLELK